MKVLVGKVPGGGFSFVSSAFCRSISNKSITVKSGLLNPDLWELGNELMADRVFTIKEYLTPLGVKLIIPSFLKGRSQFNEQEIAKSQQIANEQIHAKRMILRLKFYLFIYLIHYLFSITITRSYKNNLHRASIKYDTLK